MLQQKIAATTWKFIFNKNSQKQTKNSAEKQISFKFCLKHVLLQIANCWPNALIINYNF